MSLPKVSVVTITYNHELYILDCIKSIISQKYEGDIEFIIANDNSPDKTDNIVKDYLKTSNIPPNISIRYFKHDLNKGMMGNFIWALKQASGNYIALCEGDDYWIDQYKISKQVSFLENNLDYIMCFHQVNILKTNGEIVDDFITKVPKNSHLRETLLKSDNYIHTPSVFFRNNKIKIPDFLYQSPVGDYPLYVLLSQFGNIGYIKEKMAIYRHNVGVITEIRKNVYRNDLLIQLIVLKIIDDNTAKIVIDKIIDRFHNIPLKILLILLIKNILNIPFRVYKKIFTKK